jgi:signal peptidase
MDKLKRLWKNDYFQTALMIALVVAIVFGFWNGMAYALGTEYPMVAVSGPSMCMLPGSYCDGWSHPFERTLHDGDLVVLQGVSPGDIKIGDIIVYRRNSGDFIIHRVIDIVPGANNTLLFRTKGDGNSGEDPWGPIPQDTVIGRVILRIPWFGHIALVMRSSFAAFIIIAIIILLIFELVIPIIIGEEGEKAENVQERNAESAS